MTWIKNVFGKTIELYASKAWFKFVVWSIVSLVVFLLGTITVQAFVLRKYKRTIYQLRVATMQLQAERDVAKEKLIQAKAQKQIEILEGQEEDHSQKRKVLLEQIQASKMKSVKLETKLKVKLKRIDDFGIEKLLKNSKELQEKLDMKRPGSDLKHKPTPAQSSPPEKSAK